MNWFFRTKQDSAVAGAVAEAGSTTTTEVQQKSLSLDA
jgi:hypothetical protein